MGAGASLLERGVAGAGGAGGAAGDHAAKAAEGSFRVPYPLKKSGAGLFLARLLRRTVSPFMTAIQPRRTRLGEVTKKSAVYFFECVFQRSGAPREMGTSDF